MKKVMIVLMVSLISLHFSSCTNKSGKILGVVTYYDYNGNVKADIGSEIIIVNKSEAKGQLFEDINGRVMALKMVQTDVKLNKDRKSHMDSLSNKIADQIIALKMFEKTQKLTADGIGKFDIELMDGIYYVLTISKHIYDKDIAQINGKIVCQVIEVKSGAESPCNTAFN